MWFVIQIPASYYSQLHKKNAAKFNYDLYDYKYAKPKKEDYGNTISETYNHRTFENHIYLPLLNYFMYLFSRMLIYKICYSATSS